MTSPSCLAAWVRVMRASAAAGDRLGSRFTPGSGGGCGPVGRDPAGGGPAREDEHAAAVRQRHDGGPPGLGRVESGSGRRQARIGQRAEGLPQPALAEIQHVIVGQGADVWPDRGHARQVFRVHPVVHGLAGGEVRAAGHARFQVDDPDVRCRLLDHGQSVTPWPGEAGWPRDRPVGAYRQPDVGVRVAGVVFAQFGVARMQKYLVDAATRHDVAAREQRHQPAGHGSFPLSG